MTCDEYVKDSIKLGKDLKVGDCIRCTPSHNAAGVIVEVDPKGIKNDGEPNFSYYDLNDCSSGYYIAHLDLKQKFSVVNSRHEISRYYNVIELNLLRQSANTMDYRRDLMKIKDKAFDCLNDKADALKNKEKDDKSESKDSK